MVYLGALLINLIALPLMVNLLVIRPIVGQAWFVVITVIISYLGHEKFSFKPQDKPEHNI
jgi:putative flippase GtrA